MAYNMAQIMKYLYNLTEYFILYNGKAKTSMINNNKSNAKIILKEPPKKNNTKSLKKTVIKGHNKKSQLKYKPNYTSNINSFKSEEKLINRKTINSSKISKLLNNNNKFDFSNNKDYSSQLLKAKSNCENIEIEEYLKPDLDDMEYDDAIKLDKRSFCEYFIENLKGKQIIMNTFFYKENLRPLSIKIILFLLN